MTAEIETDEFVEVGEQEMPSFNHSVICSRILRQLFENPAIDALPELTLDIGKGITPDICVYPKEKVQPNFSRDTTKFGEMPVLAVEVISASQNIQDLLLKADSLVSSGVRVVWTVEPFTNTVFVTTPQGEIKLQHQTVESEGISVDFNRIFN